MPCFFDRRFEMGKKKSAGKGGLGSIFLTIIKILLFLFLLANFCYDGKPLWKNIIPSAGKAVEKSEKAIKKETEKAVKFASETADDAKKAADKAVKETKKTVEDATDSVKNGASGISEKDEKELEELIEKNIKK